MCFATAALIAGVAGTAVSAGGQLYAGAAKAQAANYSAEVAKNNAIKSAKAYVVAIRKHDCKALNKFTLSGGPAYQGTKGNKDYCKQVFAGHFQKWLRQTPKATPVFEGGTGGIAFFYVKTKHELTTIAMGKHADFTNRYGALTYTFNNGKI